MPGTVARSDSLCIAAMEDQIPPEGSRPFARCVATAFDTYLRAGASATAV
jgi:hypothetical protein